MDNLGAWTEFFRTAFNSNRFSSTDECIEFADAMMEKAGERFNLEGPSRLLDFSEDNMPTYEDLSRGCRYCGIEMRLRGQEIVANGDGLPTMIFNLPAGGQGAAVQKMWYTENREEFLEAVMETAEAYMEIVQDKTEKN